MDVLNLVGLRPKNPSAAAVAEAITNAETQRAAILERIAGIEARRGGLLLDGTPKELAAAETELSDQRGQMERIDAMLAALRDRHASAEKSEALAALADAKAKAEQAIQARLSWWQQHGAAMLQAIEAGHRIDRQIFDASWRFNQLQQQTAKQYPIEAAELERLARPQGDPDGWHHQVANAATYGGRNV